MIKRAVSTEPAIDSIHSLSSDLLNSNGTTSSTTDFQVIPNLPFGLYRIILWLVFFVLASFLMVRTEKALVKFLLGANIRVLSQPVHLGRPEEPGVRWDDRFWQKRKVPSRPADPNRS